MAERLLTREQIKYELERSTVSYNGERDVLATIDAMAADLRLLLNEKKPSQFANANVISHWQGTGWLDEETNVAETPMELLRKRRIGVGSRYGLTECAGSIDAYVAHCADELELEASLKALGETWWLKASLLRHAADNPSNLAATEARTEAETLERCARALGVEEKP